MCSAVSGAEMASSALFVVKQDFTVPVTSYPPKKDSNYYDSGVEDNDDEDDNVQTPSPNSSDSGVSGGSDSSQKPLLQYTTNIRSGVPQDNMKFAVSDDQEDDRLESRDIGGRTVGTKLLSGCNEEELTHIKHEPGNEDINTDNEANKDPEIQYNQPDNNIFNDKSFWIKVLVIFSILDVLLIATICVIKYGIPCGDSSKGQDLQTSEYCLNCSDVYLTGDDNIDNIYNFNKRGNECCSSNQTYIIQKYVLKRYRIDSAKASSKIEYPTRTAIHLDLDLSDNNSISDGYNQTLKWSKNDSVISGNLLLSNENTNIQVKRTGLYFISCMIVFDDTKGDVGKPGLDPMLLQLYRVRGDELQLLLENKHTHCANSDSKCNIPSSTQGVFRFETGDAVLVQVTKPCGLVLERKLNHFDMYLI